MAGGRMLRGQVAEYLTDLLGVRVTKSMLEKWASLGTGPAFSIVLGKAVYSSGALDRWGEAQLSAETPASKRLRKPAA